MRSHLLSIGASVLLGAVASVVWAKLPAPTPEQKAAAAAKAEKDAAGKAKAAKDLSEAQDKAVQSYRKGKGTAGTAHPAATGKSSPSTSSTSASQGADHSRSRPPDAELTRREAQNQMPKPGQANDHSTTARDPQNSGAR